MRTLAVAWLLFCTLAVIVAAVILGMVMSDWRFGVPILVGCAGAAQRTLFEASDRAKEADNA